MPRLLVSRAHSSAGERSLHTREVPGSIPGAPIVLDAHRSRRAHTLGIPMSGTRLAIVILGVADIPRALGSLDKALQGDSDAAIRTLT